MCEIPHKIVFNQEHHFAKRRKTAGPIPTVFHLSWILSALPVAKEGRGVPFDQPKKLCQGLQDQIRKKKAHK